FTTSFVQALICLMTSASVPAQDWKQVFSTTPRISWGSVVSSADGSRLAAVGNIDTNGAIYTSTDSGISWVSNSAPFVNPAYLAASADLIKMVAVVTRGGGIWISTNYGASWAAVAGMPAMSWSAVASSADGVNLVVAAASGPISTNRPVPGEGSIYT